MEKLRECFFICRALFLCLLTLTLCVTKGDSTTINSPDGDIIDCAEILAQKSFSHPLLMYHKLQEIPRDLPNTAQNEDEVSGWQIWNSHNGLKCPEGTIPIRRVVSPKNEVTKSMAEAGLNLKHEYAIAQLNDTHKIYGTKVTMSVEHPKVTQVNEFSLSQTWLASGSFERGDLNTIEVGWQNNAYKGDTRYNLRCPGFIQTSGNVLIEGAIEPHTKAITIQIWKDPNLGHWWLSVGPNSDIGLMPVGYWPNEIFTCLSDYAEGVQWGGEIVDSFVSGLHTTTQMGSGYLPSSARAAYMRDLEIVVDTQKFQPIYDLTVIKMNSNYYNIKKTSDTSFTYGGPIHAGT
ncbi:hypothetical protein CARUB_v10016112mg, partial [Capsella rubella]